MNMLFLEVSRFNMSKCGSSKATHSQVVHALSICFSEVTYSYEFCTRIYKLMTEMKEIPCVKEREIKRRKMVLDEIKSEFPVQK